jgi:CRP-like cAMP-binding protein
MALPDWDLLEGIPEEDVNGVLALASPTNLSEGTVLFGLGDEATDLFLVVSGKVSLTLPLRVGGGHQDALVEERLPGQILGWSGLIPPHRYTLQAVASEDTVLLGLPRTALIELFSARPEVGYAVLTNVAKVIGQRLQVFQTMWIREMQRVLESRSA